MSTSSDEFGEKMDIHELALRYCRGVDRADVALIESCFVAGATVNLNGSERSAQQLAQGIAEDAQTMVLTHFVGNHLIDLDGDRAASELYIIAYLLLFSGSESHFRLPAGTPEPASPLRMRSGRYLTQCRRDDDIWRFAALTFVEDWVGVLPLSPIGTQGNPVKGSRSLSDPVYRTHS